MFLITSVTKYSGDGLAAYNSALFTFTPSIPKGYKIHSFKNFHNNNGIFIASVSNVNDETITLRVVNIGNEIVYPGTMTCTVILIRQFQLA